MPTGIAPSVRLPPLDDRAIAGGGSRKLKHGADVCPAKRRDRLGTIRPARYGVLTARPGVRTHARRSALLIPSTWTQMVHVPDTTKARLLAALTSIAVVWSGAEARGHTGRIGTMAGRC